ncbi:MAG: MarR family transcriptional regulator [Alphaproteobacteria bacterium]|nr:MarR family transcriptional regulator [Alphaproteobacteria bacterium]
MVRTQLQTLELWRTTLVASVRSAAPDLSARQMALLLCVYLGEGPHTVRGLSKTLKISKPAISRALDRLGELGYIRRERDDLDRRNVIVQRTQEGGRYLLDYATLIEEAHQHIKTIPETQQLDFAASVVAGTMSALSPTTEQAPSRWSDIAA